MEDGWLIGNIDINDLCESCNELVDCNITFCVDNCVEASNEEHGLDWCWECSEKLKPFIIQR